MDNNGSVLMPRTRERHPANVQPKDCPVCLRLAKEHRLQDILAADTSDRIVSVYADNGAEYRVRPFRWFQ